MLPVTEKLKSSTRALAVPGAARLRVLFVIPGEAGGSSMIFAHRQAESLRRQGINVHLFHLRSRTSPARLLAEWIRFRRERRAIRPDVIHAHFGTVTGLFSVLAAGMVPVVITYRGSDLNPVRGESLSSRACLGRFLSQLAALGAGRIVCVSARLRRRLWWRREKAAVLPSGVDPEVFFPEAREKARRALGWSANQPVVLFNAGHNPRIKRLDLARAAVEAACWTLPGIRLEILDGNIAPSLVPTYMNAADCLLLTSEAEGSPTVVQEALACNLPVVSVDVGDTADRLEGVRGTRIAARDPQALGLALAEVLAAGERSDGRNRVAEFSAPRIADELARIYASLASARPA